MIKRIFTLGLLATLNLFQAQTISSGKWTDLFSYNNILSIREANGKLVAATENDFCAKGEDITVKVRGGQLVVNYTDEAVFLTGNADLVYSGTVEI